MLLISAILLVLAQALNDIVITDRQTNLTVGASTVIACSYDSTGDFMLAASGTSLSLFNRDSTTLQFALNFSIAMPGLLKDAILSSDSTWVAAIINSNDTLNSTLYLLYRNSQQQQHTINQTFPISMRATSLSWSLNDNALLVALRNQYVQVFKYNSSKGAHYISQIIETTHTTVEKVTGALSRMATCGSDYAVNIYYYNLSTGNYTFNQVLSVGAFGCSALQFSQEENRLAVGKPNGDAYILERDSSYVYALKYNLIEAHLLNVNSLMFDRTTLYLVTVGAEGQMKLWCRGNNYSKALERNLSGQSLAFNQQRTQFVVGTYSQGNISFFSLAANNCEFGISKTDPTACNCPSNSSWLNGNCTTLSCNGIPNSIGLALDNQSCVCNASYAWDSILLACRYNCSTDPSSNGTNYEYYSCFCQDGFQWNYTMRICYYNCRSVIHSNGSNYNTSSCFCDSGYSWKQGVGCALSLVNCSKVPNSDGTNFNDTTCNCNKGYSWIATGECSLNCSLIDHSTSNFNASTCNCQSNYWWNSSASQCYVNCSAQPNSEFTNFNATDCNCLVNYTWNASSCYLNCSTVRYSTGVNTNATNCQCLANYAWNSTLKSCAMMTNCANDSNSNGTNVNATACFCNFGFKWNLTAKACYRDCSNASNSIGTNMNATVCNCQPLSRWNTSANSCYLDCSSIIGSNTTNINATGCYCLTNYTWQSGLCYLNCTNQQNSNGSNLNATVCQCLTNYTWSGSACTAIPLTNCTGKANSNGSNYNLTDCYCDSGYWWNRIKQQCYLNCIDGSSNINRTACNCKWGYYWNSSFGSCAINCSNIANTNGIVNSTSCLCHEGYYFSVSACLAGVDCTGLANSDGTNVDATTCGCQKGFTYQKNWLGGAVGACRRDCQSFPRTQTAAPLIPSNCTCPNGYRWNAVDLSCDLKCEDMTYSTGVQLSSQLCECKQDYRWGGIQGQCLGASPNNALAIGLGVGIPFGIIALVIMGLAIFEWEKKRIRQARAPKSQKLHPVKPTPGTDKHIIAHATESHINIAPPVVIPPEQIPPPRKKPTLVKIATYNEDLERRPVELEIPSPTRLEYASPYRLKVSNTGSQLEGEIAV